MPDASPAVHAERFFAKAIAFEIGLGILAIGLGFLFGHDPLGTIHPCAMESLAIVTSQILVGVAAAVPLLVGLLVLDRYPWGPFRPLNKLTDEFVLPLFAGQKLWQLFLLSAAAGFGEETLFRGFVQAGLDKLLPLPHSTYIAWFIAAVLFGICHWLSNTYALLALVMGLYLGWLFLVTGSLVAPMVTHALYDFVALAYLLKWHARKTMGRT